MAEGAWADPYQENSRQQLPASDGAGRKRVQAKGLKGKDRKYAINANL
jgi:hypothetical protein